MIFSSINLLKKKIEQWVSSLIHYQEPDNTLTEF